MKITIRHERPTDYRRVEELTRSAFWNLHVPGCDEHFLVHQLRTHPDFIKELDFVLTKDQEIIANIMFSASYLVNEDGDKLETVTFGPVSVLPTYQGQGIGSQLITHAIERVTTMGYPAIIIWGNPGNYCKFGFTASKTYNVSISNKKYPCCLLVKELESGILAHHQWQFYESDVFHLDQEECEKFDQTFDPLEKATHYTQEEFAILSHAYLE
ncbi:N-acetyltransferase [bacterium]|nr:N-acetyltransferase [bacterium]